MFFLTSYHCGHIATCACASTLQKTVNIYLYCKILLCKLCKDSNRKNKAQNAYTTVQKFGVHNFFFYVFKSEMKNYLNMLHKNPVETVILSKIVAI